MSSQELSLLEKNTNVLWMPHSLGADTELAQPSPQAYYRSQIFKAEVSINPLVAAAYPLLTLATRLQVVQTSPDLTQLHTLLSHEMRAFMSQAKNNAYRQNMVDIASYLLCSLLDQTIAYTKWGKAWETFSLLPVFHDEATSPDHISQIMDRLLQRSSEYLDVLELMYVCLSFGLDNASQKSISPEFLDRLDKIYHCVREERGEISPGFLVQARVESSVQVSKERGNCSIPLVVFLSVGLLIIAHGVFFSALKLVSEPLTQQMLTFQ
jgi:type VI secretion system protein ImpK